MTRKRMVWQGGEWVDTNQSATRSHKVGTSTAKESGGKRKGKSLKVSPATERSGNVLRNMLQDAAKIDPSATITTVAKGARVKMISYIDPSKKRS